MKAIYCSIHKFEHLKIDSSTFDIFCLKCKEKNNSNGQENLHFILNKSEINKFYKKNRKLSLNEISCFKHKNKKCSFYCDECKEFICKFCFAEEHRMHKCHLPEIISEEFKNYINDSITNAEKLKPVLDNAIDEVSHISSNLKVQKNEIIKVPSTSISNINFNNKKGSFYCDECKEFICKFCFAEVHKKHKCHLPKIISNEFKKYINDSISDTEKLKPILDKAIDEVSEISSNLKVQKNDIIKVPSTIIERIN